MLHEHVVQLESDPQTPRPEFLGCYNSLPLKRISSSKFTQVNNLKKESDYQMHPKSFVTFSNEQ